MKNVVEYMQKKIAILTGTILHSSAYNAFKNSTSKAYYNKTRFIKPGTLRILFEVLKTPVLCFTIPRQDIYLIASPSAYLLGFLKKTLRRENCILIARVNDSAFESENFLKKTYFKMVSKKLDGVFLISRMLEESFRKYNKKAIIDYIYTPVSNEEFFEIQPDFKQRAIICIGISPNLRKGTDISIKVQKELGKELYILGDYKITRDIYEKNKNNKNIHFTGVKDPSQYLHKGLYFLHPARYDAGGTAVIEAMAAGLIPIVSSKTGNKDIVKEIDHSLVIDSLDYKDYAKKIWELDGLDKKELKELSRKCKQVAKYYNENLSSKQFKQKLDIMLKRIRTKTEG